jgi:hypothetical protein
MHDAGTIYVSMTGYRQDDTRPYLFVSGDTGRTWRSIAGNLPWEAVNVIKEDPADANLLYVGTDLGVYVSRNRGVRWESLSATLPSTPVHDLAVQARVGELVLGSHGRGAWILDLAPIRGLTEEAAAAPLHLFPIRSVIADWFPWETVPGDRRGRNSARFQVASRAGGSAEITVRDSLGGVVRRWPVNLLPGVNTLTWDLQAEPVPGPLRDARPGRYSVEISGAGARVSGSIEVGADPLGKPR